ncbi:GNAT family N-acetyltransferase [Bacillus massilinigeriensis]|uniref:GNAT family N-acetyltransferase n=1 Tax=Bacillus massilionigeriensis TaxID=1805475 RepID=UPI00096AE4BA|nr:GNAT family N-acetyltransferase [Bacillus massilionigeriensis]
MSHILIDFPDKIETERLFIRPCLPGDGKTLSDAIYHSRNDLKKWMPWAQRVQNIEQIEEDIRRAYSKFILREDFRLHIFRKEDQQFIGGTGLHRINWDVGKFEIGYWCDIRFQKNGYITEAVTGLTDFTFDHLKANRVEIRCDTENINSRKIPERLGFTLEGILRKDLLSADGKQLRDTCVFAKVRG